MFRETHLNSINTFDMSCRSVRPDDGTLHFLHQPLWSRETMWYKQGSYSHMAYLADLPQSLKQYGVDWFQGTPYALSPDRHPAFACTPLSDFISGDAKHSFRGVDYDTLLIANQLGFLRDPSHPGLTCYHQQRS